MRPISIQSESPILLPIEALEVGGDASANEECEGMDVDTTVTAEEVAGKEDIAEMQDDSVILPDMDSRQIKVEEPEEEVEPSHPKV